MPRLKLCAGWVTPKVLTDLAIHPTSYPHGMVKLESLKVYFGRGHRFARTIPCVQYSIRRIDDAFRCRFLIGAGGTNCPVKKALFEPDRGDLIVTQEVEFETPVRNATCDQGKYSPRSVTRYSLPFLARGFRDLASLVP